MARSARGYRVCVFRILYTKQKKKIQIKLLEVDTVECIRGSTRARERRGRKTNVVAYITHAAPSLGVPLRVTVEF